MGEALLVCEESGCASDDDARGWAAFLAENTNGLEPTWTAPGFVST
jgi:hypothetical protein